MPHTFPTPHRCLLTPFFTPEGPANPIRSIMELWTDEPAGADALLPRFVCRVSGAPADTVDTLRAEHAVSLLADLAAAEARVAERREEVSQLLFEAIGGAAEKPARNRLISLKRELYNGRVPSAQKIDDSLAGLDEATVGQVRAFVADLEAARDLNAAVRTAHDTETAALRQRFRELVQDGDFRKGLMVSSRALYGNLPRYTAAAASGNLTGRDEKTERGLLRYYTRMAAKATPFATFCAIIPGSFEPAEEGDGGRVEFRGDPRAKRSFVRINKFLYGLLFDHLKTRPAVRHALEVERNPTLRSENGRLVFLTAIQGREVFQRLGDNEVLQLIATRFSPGVQPTLGDLIRALSSDPEIDATPDEAEAYLNKLIDIGFLRFHTGIREQDADWDLPFRALLDRVDDDHARRSSALLATLRERVQAYSDAGVEQRGGIVDEMHEIIEKALDEMAIAARLRKDMPFYEDATADAEARIALTPGVRRAFDAFEEWVRLTARLAWPRPEQATMRHFFQTYYGTAQGVPLLTFYEDFYREHFKQHVEKETRQRNGANREELDGYDVSNPFGLDFIRDLSAARNRLGEALRLRWAEDPGTDTVDLTAAEVEAALEGIETLSGVPRSMGAFGLLVPPEAEGGDPSFLLHGSSYTAGYGKYFSRFLYMLPEQVQQDVRTANNALTGELLAEICGDAQFNANLHPPLLRWEISYPTGESGATDEQLRSSEILVQPDPEDPHVLRLVHGPTGRRVIPVDLGFLNPRMRPPLYQLLSRFTPPVMFAPSVPESPIARPMGPPPGAPGADGAAQGEGGPVQPDAAAPGAGPQAVNGDPADAAAPAHAQAAAAPAEAQAVQGQPAAPADGQPPMPRPFIGYRPRITYGNGAVVLARRRWAVPGELLPQRRADESAADYFVRANQWRVEHGIPETSYVRIHPQPEPRPARPGQPPVAEQPPMEAEIPGYEAPAGEGEDLHDDEPDTPDEAPAPAAAQGRQGQPGQPAQGQQAPAGGGKPKTQVSRDFYKPQFIDFGNPLVVGLLGRISAGTKSYQAVFEERLPDRAGLPRHGDDSFVTELVVQLYFPGGTASTPAGAGAQAEELTPAG